MELDGMMDMMARELQGALTRMGSVQSAKDKAEWAKVVDRLSAAFTRMVEMSVRVSDSAFADEFDDDEYDDEYDDTAYMDDDNDEQY